MRILFGGSFDPVHVGHLALVRHLFDELEALSRPSQVCMIASVNPRYRDPPKASVANRKAMLSLALDLGASVCVQATQEICESPYTVDLLRSVRARVGEQAPLAWAMGSDQYAKLHTWREWRRLKDLAHLLVFRRAGDSQAVDKRISRHYEGHHASLEGLASSPAGRLAELENRLPRVSSSEIRARLAQQKPVDTLLPPKVFEYIEAHGLYQRQGH